MAGSERTAQQRDGERAGGRRSAADTAAPAGSRAAAAPGAPSTSAARPRGVAGVLPPPPWSREQSAHRTRADRPALSRDAIVEAAVRVIDEEGFDAVSMRRVAQEFGTGAASLYAYVANKDELMDLVLDHVMAESRVADPNPAPDLEDWLEQIKDVVRRGYSTMLAHRDIAKVFLGRIPFGPNGLRNVEDLLNLLRAHGLPDYIAAYAGDLIGQYMVGSAIEDEMWRERFPDVTEQERSAAMTEVGDYLAQLPKDEFPNVTAMARLMVSEPAGEGPDPMDRFELGLDILVRGLASFLPARTDD